MPRWSLAVLVVLAAASAPGADAPALGSRAVTWEDLVAAGNGRRSQVFDQRTATLDVLELHVTTVPARQASHAPHKHEDEEIIIVKEGTVEMLLEGRTTRLGPGSVVFAASNQMHGISNVGDTPAVYHVIRWTSPGRKAAAPAK
jgi:quercetin dioxygenase-like cupin family protein